MSRSRNVLPLAVVALELAIMFAGSTLLTPLYGVYRQSFGFSELMLTLIYSAYAAGNLGALIFFGRLSDQIGRRRASLPAIGLAAISSLTFLFATGTTSLVIGRIVSGLAIGLASGTATAWIAELEPQQDKARASVIATTANYAGIALGPIVAGILAEYAPFPLRLSHVVYLAALVVLTLLIMRVRETVRRPVRGARELSLRPRLGVPREIRTSFVPPAITAFAAFAFVGFYAALAPSLMQRELHQTNLALAGALVALMFVCGVAGILSTRRVPSQLAMLSSLVALFVGALLLFASEEAPSLPLLLAATVLGGSASAVAYRGSLQVVNQIAPLDRRAEVISSYLVMAFLGNSVPVVGVGVLSQITSPQVADVAFAIFIAVLALVALATGVKLAPQPISPSYGHAAR